MTNSTSQAQIKPEIFVNFRPEPDPKSPARHTTLCCYTCILHIYPPVTKKHQTLTIRRPAHFSLQATLKLEEFKIACLRVSSDLMFLWISLNSCALNLQLVRSHQAKITIAKRLIHGRNNVTRVRVGPRSCNQNRCYKRYMKRFMLTTGCHFFKNCQNVATPSTK